jgi:hypothetical protein
MFIKFAPQIKLLGKPCGLGAKLFQGVNEIQSQIIDWILGVSGVHQVLPQELAHLFKYITGEEGSVGKGFFNLGRFGE